MKHNRLEAAVLYAVQQQVYLHRLRKGGIPPSGELVPRSVQAWLSSAVPKAELYTHFSNSKRDLTSLFKATTQRLGILHDLIRPYTPRHNGKVERSHRGDQRHFYSSHRFVSRKDFATQLALRNTRFNNRPMNNLFDILSKS